MNTAWAQKHKDEDTLIVKPPIYNYKRITQIPIIDTVVIKKDTLPKVATKYDVTNKINNFLDYVYVKTTKEKFVVQGYRIQIYLGKDREEALRARETSYKMFPKMTPYMTYSRPSFRVKVGDFMDISEMKEYYPSLKKKFPTALIVPDMVTVFK